MDSFDGGQTEIITYINIKTKQTQLVSAIALYLRFQRARDRLNKEQKKKEFMF